MPLKGFPVIKLASSDIDPKISMKGELILEELANLFPTAQYFEYGPWK